MIAITFMKTIKKPSKTILEENYHGGNAGFFSKILPSLPNLLNLCSAFLNSGLDLTRYANST